MTSSIQQTSNIFEKPASPSRSSTSSSSSSGTQVSPMSSRTREVVIHQDLFEPRNASASSTTNTPAEQHFFGALSSRVRGRSRSRSPAHIPQDRSRSPMPPTNRISLERNTSTSPRPRQFRNFSDCSEATLVENQKTLQTRRDTDSSERSKPVYWQGRHANQWLFNDFSIVDTIKGVARRARRDS